MFHWFLFNILFACICSPIFIIIIIFIRIILIINYLGNASLDKFGVATAAADLISHQWGSLQTNSDQKNNGAAAAGRKKKIIYRTVSASSAISVSNNFAR